MDQPTERERLLSLERVKDPDTVRILESLPIRESWHCLEIGAGRGSIAYWLAAKCPKGHVVAADIDTRNLDPQRSPNLAVQEVDITTHEFAPSSFDLIHVRAVLCHLSTREDVLVRAYHWMAPGGWLVVEDVYSLPVGASLYPAMNRYAAAALHTAEQGGGDLRWTNRVPAIMAQLGFTRIAADATPVMIGTGGPSDQLWRMNLEQTGPHMIRSGLLTEAELAECLRLLDDPRFVDIRHIGIAAWGQKPDHTSTRAV